MTRAGPQLNETSGPVPMINADRDHYANMSAVGSHLEQHLVEIARRAPSVIGAQLAHHRIVHPSRVDPRQHIPSGST